MSRMVGLCLMLPARQRFEQGALTDDIAATDVDCFRVQPIVFPESFKVQSLFNDVLATPNDPLPWPPPSGSDHRVTSNKKH